MTHIVRLQPTTVYADTLQNLLHFYDEADMEDRPCQFNVTKMTWTLSHPLATCLTLVVPVNRSHTRIRKPPHLCLVASFIHYLGELNFGDGIGFDFLWGEDTKLDLSDFADWSRRICKLVT